MSPQAENSDPFPAPFVPMLARLDRLPASDDGWAAEIKWDGVRAIAFCRPGQLELRTRNLRDVSPQYPEVAALSAQLGDRDAVLDGELVAFDPACRPSFSRLQQRMHQTSEAVVRSRMREYPVTYVIFDLLYLDGHNLMAEPYRRRRERLGELGLDGPGWQVPAYSTEGAAELLAATREQGLEGLVLKRIESRYSAGKRTGEWLKVKNVGRQELVIGGWLPGRGRREGRLGSLLVGYYDGGELRYAGKVGTGFSEPGLAELSRRLRPLERSSSPFSGGKLDREARFVEPELVAEVEFREMTSDGLVRHGSYKGLREDKPAAEVVLESGPGGSRI